MHRAKIDNVPGILLRIVVEMRGDGVLTDAADLDGAGFQILRSVWMRETLNLLLQFLSRGKCYAPGTLRGRWLGLASDSGLRSRGAISTF